VGIYFPQLSIGSSKWAYYFTTTYNWVQQVGVLFFPNSHLSPTSGHIIFPQLPIGSSKGAYYFSPAIKWLKQAGILFFPNHQMAQASGHIIFSTFNWLQQVGIFSQNIKLAPGSRHIFPNHQLPPASVHIIFPQLSIGPSKWPIFSQHSIGSSKRAYYTGQQIFTDVMLLR